MAMVNSFARLCILSGLRRGDTVELTDDRITIGRDLDNLVRLPDDLVSRHHAALVRQDGGYSLRDFESTNGTQVNDERITESVLRHGDLCRIGGVEVRFETAAPADV